MRVLGGMAALLLLGAPVIAGAEEEPEARESEFELPASEAWEQEGFRVQLRLGKETLTPDDAASPESSGWALSVEPGIRLSRWWSLSGTLRYAVLSEGFDGLRWSTTADLTFHPWHGLFLATGLGYGGVLGNRSFSGSGPSRCDGDAFVALGRAGWLIPMGELFAMGPVVQLDAQFTRCAARDSGGDQFEEEGGVGPVEIRKSHEGSSSGQPAFWWQHHTLQFAWSLAWR